MGYSLSHNLVIMFRFSVVFTSVWAIVLVGTGNAQVQELIKYPPQFGPPPPNSQPPENWYGKFYHLPFPAVDTHAVWVMDGHCQPIAGAEISWVDAESVSHSILTDAQGLAVLEALPVGWTKLVINRSGYLSQNKWVRPVRKLKEKVALGRPGDLMFPGTFHLFPMHNPKFRVALSPKVDNQVPLQVIGTQEQRDAELAILKQSLPESLRPYASHRNFPLPHDPTSRAGVIQKIQSSRYWDSWALMVMDESAGDGWFPKGGELVNSLTIQIPQHLMSETELTQIVNQHGFEIKYLVEGGISPSEKRWDIRIAYQRKASPDFLYACSRLYQALPVQTFQIDYIVGAEVTR